MHLYARFLTDWVFRQKTFEWRFWQDSGNYWRITGLTFGAEWIHFGLEFRLKTFFFKVITFGFAQFWIQTVAASHINKDIDNMRTVTVCHLNCFTLLCETSVRRRKEGKKGRKRAEAFWTQPEKRKGERNCTGNLKKKQGNFHHVITGRPK